MQRQVTAAALCSVRQVMRPVLASNMLLHSSRGRSIGRTSGSVSARPCHQTCMVNDAAHEVSHTVQRCFLNYLPVGQVVHPHAIRLTAPCKDPAHVLLLLGMIEQRCTLEQYTSERARGRQNRVEEVRQDGCAGGGSWKRTSWARSGGGRPPGGCGHRTTGSP